MPEQAAKKVALLIGVGEYGNGLKSLSCPVNGVEAMQRILENPDIGGFDEVVPLINPDVGEMRSRISTLFANLAKADLGLLYFTGHGIKDMAGAFHLTTSQTELFDNGNLNTGTAVEAEFVKRVMGNSYAERKVVVLDCCLAAAFADGFLGMDDSSVDVEAQLGDKGWCVLTAATSMQYALEQEGEELSVYTRYLVEGLKTGAAALDGQEHISVRHWHEYVKAQVKVAAPTMAPALFNAQQGYDICIAKALVDNEQRYRKQVQKKIRKGRVSAAGRAQLSYWQGKLGISPELAQEIEEELLKPYREKQKHLAIYEQALIDEKGVGAPFDEDIVQDFRDLQQLYNLRDEDVQPIEKKVLGYWLQVQPDPIFFAGSQPEKAPPLQQQKFPTFSFEAVRVNEKGEIVEKTPGEAAYFTEDLGSGVTLDMVRIPGGKFLMGAVRGEKGARDSEYPQHDVRVPAFWMGKFAVTQAQWKAVVGLDRIKFHLKSEPSHFEGSNRPVEQVSWDEAIEFCKRLSHHSKKEYRLPGEAEWEYACRAGTSTPFCLGETISTELANYRGTDWVIRKENHSGSYGEGPKGVFRERTTEVGQFPPNGFGLFDMCGNILEWCEDDWHISYQGVPNDGSVWKTSGSERVIRGGAWNSIPTNCRSARRFSDRPNACRNFIGFRVCCSVLGNPA